MLPSRPIPRGLLRTTSQPPHPQSALDSSASRANRKLPEAAKNVMRDWYEANRDNPYPAKHFKSRWGQEHLLKQQQIENFFINLRRRDPRRKPNKVETSSFASSAGSPSPRDGSPEPIPRHSSNPDSGTTPRAPPSGHRPTPFRSAVDSTSTRQARPTSPFNQSGTPSGHHHRAKSPPLPPYLFGPTEIEPEEAFGPASSASSSHSSSFWSAEGSASYSPHSEHSSYGQISPLDYLDSVWPTPETYSTSASAMPRRLPKVHVDPTTYYPNNFQGYCGNPYFLSEETNYHHPYSITPSDSTFHPGYFDEHRGTPKPAPSVAQHYHQRD